MSASAAEVSFTLSRRSRSSRFSWLECGRDRGTTHGFGLGAGCPDPTCGGPGIDAGLDRAPAQLLATGLGVVADSIIETHGRVVVASRTLSTKPFASRSGNQA